MKLNQLFKKYLSVLNTKQKENNVFFEELICQSNKTLTAFALSCNITIYPRPFLLMLKISQYNFHVCMLNMADML